MIAHVIGLPLEETVLELAPAGVAVLSAATIAVRTWLGRLRRRVRHRASARLEAEV